MGFSEAPSELNQQHEPLETLWRAAGHSGFGLRESGAYGGCTPAAPSGLAGSEDCYNWEESGFCQVH